MLFRDIALVDENFIVQHGRNILVENERIIYIGEAPPVNYMGEVYDGTGKMAVSGFFNAHCHSPMGLLRGYGEGLPLQRWLFERMFPFEALLTDEDCYWGALLGIAEMIQSGACSFTDMYFSMTAIASAVHESGIKANLSHGTAAGGKDDCAFSETAGYAGTRNLLDYVRSLGHNRILVDASIHAEYTSGERLCREVAQFAKENGLRMHLHLSETKAEHEEAKARRGMTACAWFEKTGLLRIPCTAAHCVWVEEADIEIMARRGVSAAHCPSSNLKLGSGIAPVPQLMKAGINIAVGTDGAASNNNLNMLEEINLAAMLQKGANHDSMLLPAQELLKIASLGGAASQGRADCGAIKVGNRADIVVFGFDSPHMRPVIDPAATLLYSAQSGDILLNMVDGRVLYRDGAFTTIDIEKVLFHATRIAGEKLAALHQ